MAYKARMAKTTKPRKSTVTGAQVRVWLSLAQLEQIHRQAVARTVEAGKPVSVARVIRDLVDAALGGQGA
jgi:hypothetical protein